MPRNTVTDTMNAYFREYPLPPQPAPNDATLPGSGLVLGGLLGLLIWALVWSVS